MPLAILILGSFFNALRITPQRVPKPPVLLSLIATKKHHVIKARRADSGPQRQLSENYCAGGNEVAPQAVGGAAGDEPNTAVGIPITWWASRGMHRCVRSVCSCSSMPRKASSSRRCKPSWSSSRGMRISGNGIRFHPLIWSQP